MDWNGVGAVVVPVDLEHADPGALATATQAVSNPASVHVVYVLPTLEPSLMVQIDVEHRKANALRSLNAWLSEQGLTGATPHVLVGKPARAIADFAASQRADMIVMAAKSRGAVSRALIGSVAERVIRLAPCPVLVMRS